MREEKIGFKKAFREVFIAAIAILFSPVILTLYGVLTLYGQTPAVILPPFPFFTAIFPSGIANPLRDRHRRHQVIFCRHLHNTPTPTQKTYKKYIKTQKHKNTKKATKPRNHTKNIALYSIVLLHM